MKNLSSLSLRLISSAVLIPVVIAAIVMGGWVFAAFVFIAMAIAYYEWLHLSKSALVRLTGIFYLGAAGYAMMILRDYPDGIHWTVFLMLAIWASDSGAYLFGKTIGGPKMSPTVSPNKTWSGYCGALLCPALVLLLCVHVLTPAAILAQPPAIYITFLVGVAVGITGQSGDLLISYMKRKVGLKDTGHLIPGHGGILDRIDALILALPLYAGFVTLILP